MESMIRFIWHTTSNRIMGCRFEQSELVFVHAHPCSGCMPMVQRLCFTRVLQRCVLCKASKKRDKISLDASIAALAIPALGTELIDPLLSACDTAFVGRIGPEPLAGVGIASSVFTYTFLFFNFLSTASSPLITQALAR